MCGNCAQYFRFYVETASKLLYNVDITVRFYVEQQLTIDNGWDDINCIVSDASRRLTTVPSTSQCNNIVCTALSHTRMLRCIVTTIRARAQPLPPLSLGLRSDIMAKWTITVGNTCLRQSSTLPSSHSD